MRKFWLVLASLFMAAVCFAGASNRDDNVVNLSTSTATKVLENRWNRKAISIKNLDSSTTVYFSYASISVAAWPATSIKTGVCAIPAGSSYNEEGDYTYSREMYMVAQPSATATVNVNVSERW